VQFRNLCNTALLSGYDGRVPGLRERKKQKTREEIVRVALALFRKRGFDGTTVADIADAAEISPRTFFAYFESKDAVVFHDSSEIMANLAERLDQREKGETTLDALRDWIARLIEHRDVLSAPERHRRELIRSTPALQLREQGNRAAFEQVLAAGIADDLSQPEDSLQAHMAASAAVAALTALDAATPDQSDADEAMKLVDDGLAFIDAGLKALARR